jgi:hypothetical protein
MSKTTNCTKGQSIAKYIFLINKLFFPIKFAIEVKPKAVRGDQVVTNGTNQDGSNVKLAEGPMDKVTTMLPTVWFGAQSGR